MLISDFQEMAVLSLGVKAHCNGQHHRASLNDAIMTSSKPRYNLISNRPFTISFSINLECWENNRLVKVGKTWLY